MSSDKIPYLLAYKLLKATILSDQAAVGLGIPCVAIPIIRLKVTCFISNLYTPKDINTLRQHLDDDRSAEELPTHLKEDLSSFLHIYSTYISSLILETVDDLNKALESAKN